LNPGSFPPEPDDDSDPGLPAPLKPPPPRGGPPPAAPAFPSQGPPTIDHLFDSDEFGPIVDDSAQNEIRRSPDQTPASASASSLVAVPGQVLEAAADEATDLASIDDDDSEDDDEAAASFTFSRAGPQKVEELDLAAMVDVAFQLVLFFLVTATTVLYKTLEIPKPNPPRAEAAAGAEQGLDSPRTLEDLSADYILVDVDDRGTFQVDRQPVTASFDALASRLREVRTATGRTGMLLTAQGDTPHRNAVLAYDAANEIGLRIALARPTVSGTANASTPRPKAAANAVDKTRGAAASGSRPADMTKASASVTPAF
jgi:biopolymer transport protein ExbD